MQARHALQSAALQFGRDGTERSLEDLRDAFQHWLESRVIGDLAGETLFTMPLGEAGAYGSGGIADIPARLREESHSE